MLKRAMAAGVLGAAFLTLAVIMLYETLHGPLGGSAAADLNPMLAAGRVVASRHGSIYGDPTFLYPPTTAILAVPFGSLSPRSVYYGFGLVEELALALACVLTLSAAGIKRPFHWGMVAASVTIVAQVNRDSFVTENLNALVVPALVGVAILWGRDRWEPGAWLLVSTALIKPILAPIVLLPLLMGHWRTLLKPAAAYCLALMAALALAPGGRGFPSLLGRIAGGAVISEPVYNLSPVTQGALHDVPEVVVLLFQMMIIAVVSVCLWLWSTDARRRRSTRDGAPQLLTLMTLLLLAAFLAGRLDETSYWLMLVPGILMTLLTSRSRLALPLIAVSVILFVAPHAAFRGRDSTVARQQVLSLAGQVACFLSLSIHELAVGSRCRRRSRSTPEAVQQGGVDTLPTSAQKT